MQAPESGTLLGDKISLWFKKCFVLPHPSLPLRQNSTEPFKKQCLWNRGVTLLNLCHPNAPMLGPSKREITPATYRAQFMCSKGVQMSRDWKKIRDKKSLNMIMKFGCVCVCVVGGGVTVLCELPGPSWILNMEGQHPLYLITNVELFWHTVVLCHDDLGRGVCIAMYLCVSSCVRVKEGDQWEKERERCGRMMIWVCH